MKIFPERGSNINEGWGGEACPPLIMDRDKVRVEGWGHEIMAEPSLYLNTEGLVKFFPAPIAADLSPHLGHATRAIVIICTDIDSVRLPFYTVLRGQRHLQQPRGKETASD